MKLSYTQIFWLFPFIFFLGGYLASTIFFSQGSIATPSLIGLTVQEAIMSLSLSNINLRVLQEKETLDLPAGTILSQTPHAGTLIKPYQSVFIVLSKQPCAKYIPPFINKTKNEIQEILKQENIAAQFFFIPHMYPKDLCIGTYPPESSEATEKIIVYISEGLHKPVIIPSFYGIALKKVNDFLSEHNVQWNVAHHGTASHSLDNCVVINQRPLAGSIVVLNDLFTVHLYCS